MNPGDVSSNSSEHLSTQQPLNFEYNVLDSETRIVVQQCTHEIKTSMQRTTQDIIDIGKKLIEVKQHLGHGSFINWLKSEFNWSVSTATKFMQVGEQFKFVNFTNLNITASALYLIAAPSTPKETRAEVLERASRGENISYTKVKAIICQHKKTEKPKFEESVTVEVPAKTTNCKSTQPIESAQYKTSGTFFTAEDLTGKEAKTETATQSLTSKDLPLSTVSEDEQVASSIKDIANNSTPTSNNIINLADISQEKLDVLINKMAITIKYFTPNQLVLVITKSANNGLSERQLTAIIKASQQALDRHLQNRNFQ
jgi:hypothetical protein